jgi:ribosomal-protein-serine acetyltransferase
LPFARHRATYSSIDETSDVLPLRLSDAHSLRLLEDSDAVELHALVEANRAYLSRWMPWASSQSLGDTSAFIESARRQAAENDGFQAAIVFEGRIAGVVGFHSVDWPHRKTSVGYWLGEEHQGRGTMTRAVRALVDHALRTWQLHRVEARVAPENVRSRAVLERLGFRREGTLRQAELVGGRFLDNVVYAVLAPEWDAPAQSPAR